MDNPVSLSATLFDPKCDLIRSTNYRLEKIYIIIRNNHTEGRKQM